MTIETAVSLLSQFDPSYLVSGTFTDSEYLLTLIRTSDNYFQFLISETGWSVEDLLENFQNRDSDFDLKLIHSDLKYEVIDTCVDRYADIVGFRENKELRQLIPEAEFIKPYLTTFEFNYSGMRLDNRGSDYPNP